MIKKTTLNNGIRVITERIPYASSVSIGIWVANGNLAIRHLGVPTVTVPMGVMADISMPVGLTFAGRAYDDNNLLRFASAFESTGSKRLVPPRTPPLG